MNLNGEGETRQHALWLSLKLFFRFSMQSEFVPCSCSRGKKMYLWYNLIRYIIFWCCICVLTTEVKNSEEQYNKIVIPNEESVVIYYKIRQQLAKLGKEIEEYIHKPKYCLPFLQPGRLVKVCRFFFFFHKLCGYLDI